MRTALRASSRIKPCCKSSDSRRQKPLHFVTPCQRSYARPHAPLRGIQTHSFFDGIKNIFSGPGGSSSSGSESKAPAGGAGSEEEDEEEGGEMLRVDSASGGLAKDQSAFGPLVRHWHAGAGAGRLTRCNSRSGRPGFSLRPQIPVPLNPDVQRDVGLLLAVSSLPET
jgi:hypothetical protein